MSLPADVVTLNYAFMGVPFGATNPYVDFLDPLTLDVAYMGTPFVCNAPTYDPIKVGRSEVNFAITATATGRTIHRGEGSASFGITATAAGTVRQTPTETHSLDYQHLGYPFNWEPADTRISIVTLDYATMGRPFASNGMPVYNPILTGNSSASFAITASATGRTIHRGTSAVSFSITASAAGNVRQIPTKTDSMDYHHMGNPFCWQPADTRFTLPPLNFALLGNPFASNGLPDYTPLLHGVSSVNFAITASATGRTIHRGVAAATIAITASAAGVTRASIYNQNALDLHHMGNPFQWTKSKASFSYTTLDFALLGNPFASNDVVGGTTRLGEGSAEIVFTTTATGRTIHRGEAATNNIVFTASATGRTIHRGVTDTASIVFTASATGNLLHLGEAAANIVFTTDATGRTIHRGEAAADIVFTTEATGRTIHRGVTDTASIVFTTDATGNLLHLGDATSSISINATATGRLIHRGAATTIVEIDVDGEPTVIHRGSCTASITISATATLRKHVFGSGSAAIVFTTEAALRRDYCGPAIYATDGRDSIAVDQPPYGGSNYPFVDPSSEILQTLADLYLLYKDDNCQYQQPFKIAWMWGFGCQDVDDLTYTPVHDYDLAITDANDEVVFDTRELDEPVIVPWGDRLQIIEWRDLDTEEILRVVTHEAWDPDLTVNRYPVYVEPENAILDIRTLLQLPPRVRSIRVTELGDRMQENVKITNGYNTSMTVFSPVTTDGARRTTTFSISAAPGLGDGRYDDGCDEEVEPAIRRVNSIKGDSTGNFVLDAADKDDRGACYRIERPIIEVLTEATEDEPSHVQVQDHALLFSNDCGPCCECEDFIAVYEAIRRLRNRYADLILRAQAARDLYVLNRARFLEQRACRDNEKIRIILQPFCPSELGVAVGFCNNGDSCVTNLVIVISFDYEDGSGCIGQDDTPVHADTVRSSGSPPTISCNSTFRSGNLDIDTNKGSTTSVRSTGKATYVLGGTWPHYWVFFDAVDPGTLGSITFRLNFPDATTTDNIEAIADAYATGIPQPISPSGPPIPGYVVGVGPTTPQALASRMVTCPAKASSGLLPGETAADCCDT